MFKSLPYLKLQTNFCQVDYLLLDFFIRQQIDTCEWTLRVLRFAEDMLKIAENSLKRKTYSSILSVWRYAIEERQQSLFKHKSMIGKLWKYEYVVHI